MATADDRARIMRQWVAKAAKAHGVPTEAVLSGSRQPSAVNARWAAIRRAEEAGWSYWATAKAIGMHHTSIMHALGRLPK